MKETYKQKLQAAFESQTADPPDYGKYILKGDVSGIQNFIFNIQSEGAARMLKARSFFIQIAVQLCIEKIKMTFTANKPSIISDSGGSFYIEFHTEPEGKELDRVFKTVNEQLANYDLFISITVERLKSWSDAMKLLKNKEETQKFQRYTNSPDAFNPVTIERDEKEADAWKEFAKELSQSKGYRIEECISSPSGISTNAVILWGLKFQLEKENPKVSFDDPHSSFMNLLPVWRKENPYWKAIENDSFEQENDFMENRESKYNKPELGDIIDFDHLALQAKIRTGTDNLGVLKLDVDNLGSMFHDVFTTKEKYTNASDAFGYFFGIRMKELWTTQTFTDLNGNTHHFCDNTLIIFSGGDDCLLLGGWDAVMEFTSILQKEFASFCEGLPLTFSAAILLVHASTPVIQIGHLAEAELEKAKQFSPAKNAVSVFGEVFCWDEFKNMKELTHVLADLIKGNEKHPPESKALLQKIRLSARGYDALMRKADIKKQVNFQKVWNLTWFILRGVKEENRKTIEEKIVSSYHDAAITALMTGQYAKALIYPAAARWTELLTRKTEPICISTEN
jgi:CRISPR-associated protein Csm1